MQVSSADWLRPALRDSVLVPSRYESRLHVYDSELLLLLLLLLLYFHPHGGCPTAMSRDSHSRAVLEGVGSEGGGDFMKAKVRPLVAVTQTS